MITIALLIAATVLFLLAAFGVNDGRLIPAGLACLSAALVVGQLMNGLS